MKSRGFTLIELMIVIVIIGILASVVAGHKKDDAPEAGGKKIEATR